MGFLYKIRSKLKILTFFLNFDLAKGGRASAPLAFPGCALAWDSSFSTGLGLVRQPLI